MDLTNYKIIRKDLFKTDLDLKNHLDTIPKALQVHHLKTLENLGYIEYEKKVNNNNTDNK